ncbi:lamin tail domain-containing protein 1 [Limosa lapponica baueri]|uniref:Lamin tail domain-containing protein 1 n=1 Tax=Limosa lapponica baueri TaxID=1758121 RepID=A0A2I0TY16_LIMLA|nr:lamin tail domain-containing protein 1 [Limosa lapponica baueri]
MILVVHYCLPSTACCFQLGAGSLYCLKSNWKKSEPNLAAFFSQEVLRGLQVPNHNLPKERLQSPFDHDSERVCLALIVLTVAHTDISQAVFRVQRAQEAPDLLARKKALQEVQENYVFLESEIKSPRDVPGGGNSAIGNLKIAEVDPGGYFVKILNCAPEKEESIGDYLLKQDVQNRPVAVFRFPPETRMGPNSTVTVWAADAKALHRPPSDFLWKDLERFRTSLDCATILCEPGGQLSLAILALTSLPGNQRLKGKLRRDYVCQDCCWLWLA